MTRPRSGRRPWECRVRRATERETGDQAYEGSDHEGDHEKAKDFILAHDGPSLPDPSVTIPAPWPRRALPGTISGPRPRPAAQGSRPPIGASSPSWARPCSPAASSFCGLWEAGSSAAAGSLGVEDGDHRQLPPSPYRCRPTTRSNRWSILRAFRDLSYVPVKGMYMTSYAAGSSEVLGENDRAGRPDRDKRVRHRRQGRSRPGHVRGRRAHGEGAGAHRDPHHGHRRLDRDSPRAQHHPHRPAGLLQGHHPGHQRGPIWPCRARRAASGRTGRDSTTRIPTTTRCGSTWSRWPRTPPGTASGRSSSTTSASPATARSRRRSIPGSTAARKTPSPGSWPTPGSAWRSWGSGCRPTCSG